MLAEVTFMMPIADAGMPAIPTSPADPCVAGGKAGGALSMHLAEMLAGLVRIVDLQLQIGLARLTATFLRTALFMMTCLCGLVFATVAVLFLYAGVYRVLTDILLIRAPWSLLIFAGAHFVMAGVLAVIAIALLGKRRSPKLRAGGAS